MKNQEANFLYDKLCVTLLIHDKSLMYLLFNSTLKSEVIVHRGTDVLYSSKEL